jgi:processive 1,2-diacylglycerol beta-glucosyltransferase
LRIDLRSDSRSRPHSYPRVLVCAADVGCGHGRAAAAVALAMRRGWPGIQVKLIDALATTPGWFNRIYKDSYLFAAKYLPRVNGWLYDRTDVAGTPTERGIGPMIERRALTRFCDSPPVRDADLIVCTHFLCARVLSQARGRGMISGKIAVIVTDQHPHAIWRVPNAELFMVASDAAAQEMARQGIDGSRTLVTGIPIDRRFDHPIAKSNARRRHKLPASARVILLCGGGLGLGGIDRALEGILQSGEDVHTIVVCGRNLRLFEQLKKRTHGIKQPCRILGHTTRMHELMAAADLLVGKPGGLTTSEACAVGLPMLLLRPLPGQEEHNAMILTRVGAARLEIDPFAAGQAAAALVVQRETIDQMSERARGFGRVGSARFAAEAAIALWPPTEVPSHRQQGCTADVAVSG